MIHFVSFPVELMCQINVNPYKKRKVATGKTPHGYISEINDKCFMFLKFYVLHCAVDVPLSVSAMLSSFSLVFPSCPYSFTREIQIISLIKLKLCLANKRVNLDFKKSN